MVTSEYPITSEAFFADPFPTLHRMREAQPVYFHEPIGAWFLARHDHCDAAVRDRRLINARARALLSTMTPALRDTPALETMVAQWSRLAWFLDPPEHTRSRAMINRAFSAARLETMRGEVRAAVDAVLQRRGPDGALEAVWDFADPIALSVLCMIFGLPEADRAKFIRWTTALIGASGAGEQGEDGARAGHEATVGLFEYISALVAERRARPGEDVISRFLGGEGEDPAVREEITIQCFGLIAAGYVTSRNQIAGAILTLLEHPEQLARLRADRRLLGSAVEEVLRYAPAVLTTNRLAAEDLEIGGRMIARGQLVFPILASANRDPAVYPDPDRFDVGRGGVKVMTFSFGPHYCPGGALIRLELEEVLGALLEFPTWERTGDHDYAGANLQDRGPSRLPIRLLAP